jgi:preprotein translocase subunit SecY
MLKTLVTIVLFVFFAVTLIVIFLELGEEQFPTKEEKKLNNLEDDDEQHY